MRINYDYEFSLKNVTRAPQCAVWTVVVVSISNCAMIAIAMNEWMSQLVHGKALAAAKKFALIIVHQTTIAGKRLRSSWEQPLVQKHFCIWAEDVRVRASKAHFVQIDLCVRNVWCRCHRTALVHGLSCELNDGTISNWNGAVSLWMAINRVRMWWWCTYCTRPYHTAFESRKSHNRNESERIRFSFYFCATRDRRRKWREVTQGDHNIRGQRFSFRF